MSRGTYNAEFKTKVVLEVIQGDEKPGAIANKYSINPNMRFAPGRKRLSRMRVASLRKAGLRRTPAGRRKA
jgi:transposase-like protein